MTNERKPARDTFRRDHHDRLRRGVAHESAAESVAWGDRLRTTGCAMLAAGLADLPSSTWSMVLEVLRAPIVPPTAAELRHVLRGVAAASDAEREIAVRDVGDGRALSIYARMIELGRLTDVFPCFGAAARWAHSCRLTMEPAHRDFAITIVRGVLPVRALQLPGMPAGLTGFVEGMAEMVGPWLALLESRRQRDVEFAVEQLAGVFDLAEQRDVRDLARIAVATGRIVETARHGVRIEQQAKINDMVKVTSQIVREWTKRRTR